MCRRAETRLPSASDWFSLWRASEVGETTTSTPASSSRDSASEVSFALPKMPVPTTTASGSAFSKASISRFFMVLPSRCQKSCCRFLTVPSGMMMSCSYYCPSTTIMPKCSLSTLDIHTPLSAIAIGWHQTTGSSPASVSPPHVRTPQRISCGDRSQTCSTPDSA